MATDDACGQISTRHARPPRPLACPRVLGAAPPADGTGAGRRAGRAQPRGGSHRRGAGLGDLDGRPRGGGPADHGEPHGPARRGTGRAAAPRTGRPSPATQGRPMPSPSRPRRWRWSPPSRPSRGRCSSTGRPTATRCACRCACRPPLVLGPVPLAWLAAVVAPVAGALLLAAEQWLAGAAVLAVGLPLAAVAVRALHGLTRRWVVFVPAGFVLHDHHALVEPVLFPRRSIRRLGPAPADPGPDTTDLTQGALGLALELELADPVRHRASSRRPDRRGRVRRPAALHALPARGRPRGGGRAPAPRRVSARPTRPRCLLRPRGRRRRGRRSARGRPGGRASGTRRRRRRRGTDAEGRAR